MSKFSERLQELGFASYQDYLNSEHWESFKKRYRRSGRSCKCAVCGLGKIQLHHHSYARLGAERLDDMTPLCREHHLEVHAWLDENKKGNVQATAKAVKAIRKEFERQQPKESQEKCGSKRKNGRATKALVAKLYELQQKTQMVPKQKCDNVVACDDVRAIQHFIDKMSGKAPDRKKKDRKQKHPTRPVAPAQSPEHPKVKLEKHSEYVARMKRTEAAMEDLEQKNGQVERRKQASGFSAAAVIFGPRRQWTGPMSKKAKGRK